MKIVDLHTHSTFSDGSYTPIELVSMAKKAGLAALAITDHDNISAFKEAKEYAQDIGIELYSGIEMSVNYRGGQIHMVGLGFDIDDPYFQNAYRRFRQLKEDCVKVIHSWLKSRGVSITDEQLAPYKKDGIVDRYTFFRYFASGKSQEDVQYIWDEYLDPALKGMHVDIEVQDAICMIKEAGGVTSLAHFHKTLGLKRFSVEERELCIKELKEMGMDALEVQYPDFSPNDKKFITAMAEKYSLYQTGGTDFHGNNRPSVELGTGIKNNLSIPYKWTKFIPKRYPSLS